MKLRKLRQSHETYRDKICTTTYGYWLILTCPPKCHNWQGEKELFLKIKDAFYQQMWEEIKCHSYSRNCCSSKNEPIDHEFFYNFSELRVDSCPKPFASHPAYEMSKFRKHSVKEMLKRSKMRKSVRGVGHSVNEKKVNKGTGNIENEKTKEEKGNDCIKEDKIDGNSHKWTPTVIPKKPCLQQKFTYSPDSSFTTIL